MKAQQQLLNRGPLNQLLILLGACILCLGTGYYKGALNRSAESSTLHDNGLLRRSDPAAHTPSIAQLVRGEQARISPSQPYHAPGATRFEARDPSEPLETVCLNTCKQANNGLCDDGRWTQGLVTGDMTRMVTCDLGTDCADCGPWTPSGHAPWITDNVPGPIARLMTAQVEVRVRTTLTNPRFEFAYTDPVKDLDVSHHISAFGVVEAGITQIFTEVFKEGCAGTRDKPGLFVDVGANFGWFSVLAAAMGCRVIAFEPVPHFAAFFEYSVHKNNLAHLVDMRGNVVSHVAGSSLKMVVPSQGIWGTAGIGGLNIDKAIKDSVNKEIDVPSQKLDDLIPEDVLLMKVDVEGWEWSVMQGAAQLFAQHNVQNVIMEYSPGVTERANFAEGGLATVQMLVDLVDQGFRLAHIGEYTKHETSSSQGDNQQVVLPAFEEITGHNLMYDLVDAKLFYTDSLGCPIDSTMRAFSQWFKCNCLPEDLSPRSLRALFGHNTNIWAAKGSRLQKLGRPVGIMSLEAPEHAYFVEEGSKLGMGVRACDSLDGLSKVRHRCPCLVDSTCGAEAEAVQALAVAGTVPSNYVLTPDGALVQGSGGASDLFKSIRTAREIGEPYRQGKMKPMANDMK